MAVTISGTTGVSLADTNAVPTAAVQDLAVTPAKLSQKLTQGTAVATTSGTAVNFTGIPSWVTRITVVFNGISTNSSGGLLLQLGDSGGVETTGYLSQVNSFNNTPGGVGVTNGVQLTGGSASTYLWNGIAHIVNISGNTWVVSGTAMTNAAASTAIFAGSKTLSAVLDKIRVTSTSGDTFDAGTINILYE